MERRIGADGIARRDVGHSLNLVRRTPLQMKTADKAVHPSDIKRPEDEVEEKWQPVVGAPAEEHVGDAIADERSEEHTSELQSQR